MKRALARWLPVWLALLLVLLDLIVVKVHWLHAIISKLIEQRGRVLVQWTNDGQVTLLDVDAVAAEFYKVWNISTDNGTRRGCSLTTLVAVLDLLSLSLVAFAAVGADS